MVLLRRVIGDTLRLRRQSQHRTLREVSTAANVSLGYLSEIERGQKEASSELLSAICDALGAAQSEVLRAASDTLALAEEMERMLACGADDAQSVPGAADLAAAGETKTALVDGEVAISVRHDGPLKTTLRATRAASGREIVRAA
jgi:transcriptional regulator with XRE-family HTH domain